jgi:hypothetical protein
VITVQPVDLVLWEKQLMLKRVTEVLMVSYKFFIFYWNIIFLLYIGLPGGPGLPGPAGNIENPFFFAYKHLIVLGIPGGKGDIGEKGFAGEETYGIYIFLFFSVWINETFLFRTTWS